MENQTTQSNRSMVPASFEQCLRDCLECYQSCTRCIQHCLSKGGEHVEQRHISLMMECARICQISTEFMLSNSPYAEDFCQICARVCDDCARSCASIDPNDQMMKDCAEVCKRCADSCRNMGH